MKKNKIDAFIVNFNTQELTEACVKSINAHTKDVVVHIFDNSDKTPFKNTFDNVELIDNTKGQIIDFDKWIGEHQYKRPMSNSYGSAKHCYTIQKIMDMFDENFILLDSDVIVKKDISELYDDKYIFVGEEFGKLGPWKPRVLPYICFINNKMCKENNIKYFDDNRMAQVSKNSSYDTGSSFLEDASKYPHKLIKCSDYVEHLKAGSWTNVNAKEFIMKNEQYLK